MAKPDEAHRLTDIELSKLEKRIQAVYKEAYKDLDKTVNDYFEKLVDRDKHQQELLEAGKITKEQYTQWRLSQIGRGERFEALRDEMARRYTNANEVAISYVNDATPGIYSLNRNYSAYTIDKATDGGLSFQGGKLNGDFILFDERTVKRLIVEQPDLMPNYPKAKALKRGIDLEYGKKQITASVTGGILQGKSVYKIADDLQSRISDMNRTSAVRTARTAVTGAQNAGRQDTYVAAQKMGIKLKKRWVATLDGRTRHSHALLDGEVIEVGGIYSNGCRFPGDPQGDPQEIYNCRCTEIAVLDGVDTSDDLRRDKNGILPDMTYAQWEASRRGAEGIQLSPYHTKTGNSAKDVTSKYIKNAKPGMGKVRYQTGYDLNGHKAEVKTANQLRELFGGKLVLLKESNENGKKTPDYLWNGKGWEQKTISTAKAADSALRGALKQIAENPGGVVFECSEQIDIEFLTKQIDDRAFRKIEFDYDVIALRNGELLFARRYKK